jgi:hypothetical protein
LKLETLQFMPGIKNLNLKIICIFVLFSKWHKIFLDFLKKFNLKSKV